MTTQSNGESVVVQGRIVWVTGKTVFEGQQKTDYNTNAALFDDKGQPRVEYGLGLAIPKLDPATGQSSAEFTKVWAALHNQAYTLYPDGNLPPNFAMKFKDGDGVDHKGVSFTKREGYEGHIILTCTTQIPIKFFRFEGGNNILVNDGIKNGDYVNVQLNIKAHPAKNNGLPGLYLNPSAVQLIQPGKEIVNTPSGDQLFGAAAPVYAGQVQADVAPTMPTVAPAQPQMTPAPAMPAQQAVQPHYDVLPQTMQPAGVPPMPGNVPPAGVAAPQATPTQAVQQPATPASPGNMLPPMPGAPR